MIKLHISNRIHVLGEVPDTILDEICRAFTYDNPDYAKAQAFGFYKRVPKYIQSWSRCADGLLSVPRGGYQKLVTILNAASIKFTVDTERVTSSVSIPASNVTPFDYQARMIDAAIAKFADYDGVCLWRSSPACVAGSTIVGVNRAGKSFNLPIADVVHRFNGGRVSNRIWDPLIETYIRGRDAEGSIRLIRLVDAVSAGVRDVRKLTTASGRSLEATDDHLFLTRRGWVQLSKLRIGDEVSVEGHPETIPDKRIRHYIARLRSGDCSDLYFIPPEMPVHHIDENCLNNSPANLAVMSLAAHQAWHGLTQWRNVNSKTTWDRICDISDQRSTETYDLVLEDPHCYLANGIVVHNSGKTTAALMLATIMRVKTIVIISNSVLMRQWCERIRRELGIEPGIVGGGKRNLDPPIVVAMQQSICKLSDRDIARFGLLIGDEIQQFGAATFQESVNRFPARYRLGVSGDEHRADRKECLIYDQFGPVSVEVKSDELVSCGRIHEVEIRIVPTEFKAEWWSAIDAMKPRPGESFEKAAQRRAKAKIAMAEKLASELASDQERNDLIVSLAKQSVADTGRVMVLSTRREHCHVLDSRITAAGLTSGLLIGGADYREEFARTLRAFTSNSIQAAVGTYQAIGVGFDLPVVARGICASPVANSQTGDKQWRQYRGRFARTADGKGDAALYYIWDQHVFGLKPLRHLARWNARVVVWDGQAWIPIKQWMVRIDGPKTKRHSNFATTNSSRTAASSDSTSSSGETAAVDPTTASDHGLGIRRRLRSEVTEQ